MKSLRKITATGFIGFWLVGCTLVQPPSYNLPPADSIASGVTYRVKADENIYTVAIKNGVKLREIIVLNHLKPPFALKTGDVITLPAKDGQPSRSQSSWSNDPTYAAPTYLGAPSSASSTAVTSAPLAPIETAPPITNKPMPLTTSPSREKWIASSKTAEQTELQHTAPDPQSPAAKHSQEPTPTELLPEPPKQIASTQSGDDHDLTFGWPVRGTIISAFGPKGKGLDNDGINISAPKGAPVKASENGIVAYAGNDMKGFGNLILIRHQNKWVTAYAHLGRLMVSKDNTVAKGDIIGTIGSTGNVSSPQLHFETRRDSRPVDPELMIR